MKRYSKHTAGFSHEDRLYGYELNFYSEVIDGDILDTEVVVEPDSFNGVHLCVIAGKDIDAFDKEFTELINKYKI